MQVPEGSTTEVMFGVATRKNAAFYKSLDEQGGVGAFFFLKYCSRLYAGGGGVRDTDSPHPAFTMFHQQNHLKQMERP
jgi:hypothetical protein